MSLAPLDSRNRIADLYVGEGGLLARYVLKHGAQPEDADDIVSEAFATLLVMEDDRLEGIRDLRAYLFTIGRNLAIRTAQRRGRVSPVPDHELDLSVTDDDHLVATEDRELARRAFASLAPAQQEILWRTGIRREGSREVASALGTSVSSVTSQAQRARAALREAYITAFVEARPLPCGTDSTLLARVALGTASARALSRFEKHAQTCPSCVELLLQARSQASSRALVFVVALGGVAAGGLSGTLHPETSTSPHPDRGRRSGRRRLALALAALVLLLLAPLQIFRDQVLQAIQGSTPVQTEPLDEVGIDATPDQISLQMPAPGESVRRAITLTSSSTVATSIVLSVTGATGSGPEEPLVEIVRDGISIVAPVELDSLASALYLGELPPGEEIVVDVLLSRDAADTDENLSSVRGLRFVAGVGLGDGLTVGSPVEHGQPQTSLAATGLTALPWVLTALLLVGLGAWGVERSSRSRGRRRPSTPSSA